MSFRRSLLIWLAAASWAGAADLPLEKRVVEHTCANGIKLLILERHFSPTVSIRMIFRTGSVDEVSGKTGLAHMFEHMMFKGTRTLGTKNYAREAPLLAKIDQIRHRLDAEQGKEGRANQAQIARLIDQLRDAEQRASELAMPNELWNLYEREGASNLNAGTAPDLTQYVVNLPSNKLALWALLDSDRLKNPVFRQFYQEREVVKEERRMRVDTHPDGKLYETFLSTAYAVHPYRNPTIGWAADLDQLTVRDLDDFYRRYYTPGRLTIVLVGDVKARDVIALVDKHFGSWRPDRSPRATRTGSPYTRRVSGRPPAAPALRDPPPEPRSLSQRRQILEFDAGPQLIMGFRIPRYPDPDTFAFSALASLLGDGKSSRLQKGLVEKKRVASAVDADPAAPGERYDPQFVISATPRFPHLPSELEHGIWNELDRLKNNPVEPWELEKVRARVDIDLLNTLQTNDGMASTLAYYQCIFGDWRLILRYQKAIEALTAQDIQRVAQRIFLIENSTVVTRLRKKEERKK